MAYIVDATGTSDYTVRDSDGPAACLEFEGTFDLILTKAARNEKLSPTGLTTVKLTYIVQDNDFEGAKGATIYQNGMTVSGSYTGRDGVERFNVVQLIDLCNSAGREDLASMIIGKKFDLDKLLTLLVGDGKSTHVYARLENREDNKGTMKSEIKFFIAKGKSKYEELRQVGGNSFRSKPRSAPRKAIGVASNGASNGTHAIATDDMLSGV